MITDTTFSQAGILTKREFEEQELVVEAGEDDLDRNAFLQLLTTQLQNQNPLDPMKNEEFVAQLAQFSQLEGITNMSTELADVANVIRSDRILAGANFVGKTVLAQSGNLFHDGQAGSDLQLNLPYGAQQVRIDIVDPATGGVIRSLSAGAQGAGTSSFQWDGRNFDGQLMQSGTYNVRAVAQVNGQSEAVIPETYARVDSVSWNATQSDLLLNLDGGASVPLNQVTRISQPTEQPIRSTENGADTSDQLLNENGD